MNRTNRTSDFRLSGVKAGVRALPDHRAPNIRGGMGHKSAGGCSNAIILILLCCRRLPTTTRPDRADTAENGRTEATPPFLPLYRQTGRGFVAGFVTWYGAYPAPPLWGSLPSKLSLREDSEPERQSGADAPQESLMKWRYSFLILGGLGFSAWGFLYRPFPLPGNDPMLDLVLYHTPNFYAWVVR